MPDPETANSKSAHDDDQPDATNKGESAEAPAEGGNDAPGGGAGSPERDDR